MTEPLVTILIPVFRRLQYLPEALASALAQTWRHTEILVTDDGPSPEVEKLIAKLGDPRLRYRNNGGNVGIALNHQAAFREARGKFIANLDDDDMWEPRFLEELVPAMEADPEINVAFCDHYLIDREGRYLEELTELNSRRYRRSALMPGRHQPFLELATVRESIPMAMGAVFRASMLQDAPFPRQVGGCYDHWLAYLAARGGKAAYYCPKRLTHYRVHDGSASNLRGLQNLRNAIFVRSQFLKDPALTPPGRKQLRNNLGVHYGKMALHFLRTGHRQRARVTARRAYALMSRPKTIVGLSKNLVLETIRGRRQRAGAAA